MYEIAQSADYTGTEGVHQWECSFEIAGADAELDRIKQVVYTLDPSFPSPVRRVDDRASNFRLTVLCWASFTLYASIERHDGAGEEPLSAEVDLTLPPAEDASPSSGAPAAPEIEVPLYQPPALTTEEADLVLDGGNARAVAFSAALEAAEEAGVERWGQIAGSSAGALVGVLLAAGYRPAEVTELLLEPDYSKLFKHRRGGPLVPLRSLWSNRGLFSIDGLRAWLEARLADSSLGNPRPTFGGLAANSAVGARSRYGLRIIVSDLTAARMVVLPDDIEQYEDAKGNRLVADDFSIVDAVMTSMRAPFLFEPSVLHSEGTPHYLLDGGLLSNFPVWLFDSAYPQRPTWGIRLRTSGGDIAVNRPAPTNALRLTRSMISAVLDAARELEPARNQARTLTVPVPPGTAGPQLTSSHLDELRAAGYNAGTAFFTSRGAYINSLRRGLPEEALLTASASDLS